MALRCHSGFTAVSGRTCARASQFLEWQRLVAAPEPHAELLQWFYARFGGALLGPCLSLSQQTPQGGCAGRCDAIRLCGQQRSHTPGQSALVQTGSKNAATRQPSGPCRLQVQQHRELTARSLREQAAPRRAASRRPAARPTCCRCRCQRPSCGRRAQVQTLPYPVTWL